MKEESGRSLVEIIGVLAIGAIMIASAYSIYQSINNRQTRLIASETLKDVAAKTKTLYEFSGYGNVNLSQLQTDGVLTNTNPPIGGAWEIKTTSGGTAFTITLKQLSYDDCEYFAVKKSDWAKEKKINNKKVSDGGTCAKKPTGDKNMVAFTVQ